MPNPIYLDHNATTPMALALAQWIDEIPPGQKGAWKDLVKAVSNWL